MVHVQEITNDIELIGLRPEPTGRWGARWMTRLMWSAWRVRPRLMDGSARSGKLMGIKSPLVMGQFSSGRQATRSLLVPPSLSNIDTGNLLHSSGKVK